jgi:hypothetical protein
LWPEEILAIPAGNLAFPYHRHLKSSSPQVAAQDNEIKAGIFPGKVIIGEHGKQLCISTSIDMNRPQIPQLPQLFLWPLHRAVLICIRDPHLMRLTGLKGKYFKRI